MYHEPRARLQRFSGEEESEVEFEPYVSVRGKGIGRVIKNDLGSRKGRTDAGFASRLSTT